MSIYQDTISQHLRIQLHFPGRNVNRSLRTTEVEAFQTSYAHVEKTLRLDEQSRIEILAHFVPPWTDLDAHYFVS